MDTPPEKGPETPDEYGEERADGDASDGPPDDLDPEMAAVIEDLAAGLPSWHALSVAAARRIEDDLFASAGGPDLAIVRDVAIDGPGGDLPLRLYRPDVDGPAPILLFCHGGGWVLGTLDSADDICRELAAASGCLVASLEYRLAPEHPFPAAVDDAWAALGWLAEHGDAIGGDPDRIGVGGTSAGGGIAAATALRARAFDGPSVAHQVLAYPALAPAFDTDSYLEHADATLLSRADMRWFWSQYLHSPVDRYNPFAAPLRAGDLAGLPSATVATAGIDVLREEGRAYADRLTDAGVAVDRYHYPSLAHGFLSTTDAVGAAATAMQAVAGSLRSHLE